jgi:ATP-dependent DNA helicase RecG
VAEIALDTPVQYAKGVGPTRAEQLSQLGVHTVEDLLTYYPFRFDLRRQVQPIESLRGDESSASVAGEIVAVENHPYGRRPWFGAQLSDDTGWVLLKWFHGNYLRDKIRTGIHLAVSGKVSVWREHRQFLNPSYQILWDPATTQLDRDEMMPVYPAGGKLTSAIIGRIVRGVLPRAQALVPRWFSREYLAHRGMPTRPEAVGAMHHPEDKEHWAAARRRIAYDECLLMQLGIALMRMRHVQRPAHPLPCSPEIDRRIRKRFPFQLTEAQDRVVAEISEDLARPRPMSRLLQGDVGSGKTVVALYAGLLAIARGKQAAIMAPTEILATQHYRKLEAYLEGSRVRIALLVGAQPAAERKRIVAGLAEGEIDLVVGTHALLGEKVHFRNLALVVVDEQHKFGVSQRKGIRGKGYAPHYLVMTATPIPRTLAMTLFGDLDVSILDAPPPGRGTTSTTCVTPDGLPEVHAAVRKRLDAGQQAYFIYPLVTASPQLELTAAEEAFTELAEGPLAGYRVGLVHGQMSAERKEAVMGDFRDGKVQALVASVVVEVGVDVSSANVMVIHHAERFGLAQLHQLRGRIGRGRDDAACYLVASPRNPVATQRLQVLTETNDGFRIAEEDLRIRGPGEIFSTRQHGLPELKVADLSEDYDLLRMARRDAFEIVREDPDLSAPHHQQLRHEVQRAYGGRLTFLAGA